MSTGATHLRLRIFLCVACICAGVALLIFFRLPSHRVVDSSGDAYAVSVPGGTAALVQQVLFTGPGRITSAEVLLSKPAEAAGVPSGVVRVFDKTGRQVAQAPVPSGRAFERQYVTVEVTPALRLSGRSWLYVSVSAGDSSPSPGLSAWLNPRQRIGAQFELTGAAEGSGLPAALATAQQRPGALCLRVTASVRAVWPWSGCSHRAAAGVPRACGCRLVAEAGSPLVAGGGGESAADGAGSTRGYERSRFGAPRSAAVRRPSASASTSRCRRSAPVGLAAFVVLVGSGVHYSSIEDVERPACPRTSGARATPPSWPEGRRSVRSDEWNATRPGPSTGTHARPGLTRHRKGS